LVALSPSELASRVPTQAGLRYARCPSCFAVDVDEPLAWSADEPDALKCVRCGTAFTGLSKPAEAKPTAAAGTDPVEVRPGVVHKYPFWTIDPAQALFPEEKAHLAARRDFKAREWLAKAALYAATASRPDAAAKPAAPNAQGAPGPAEAARAAATLVIRFAQVYPDYASHLDLPGRPKDLGPARPIPPYRRGYATGKWTDSGADDVPLNLLIAYAIVRDAPAWDEAARGQNLDPDEARRIVEEDLFRASAAFVRNQPEETSEASLTVYRGMLAVGRLLDDPLLVHESIARLAMFAERGFSHDGLWRGGDGAAHRRVMAQVDGWLDRLLAGYSDPPSAPMPADGRRYRDLPGTAALPVLLLAREAGAATTTAPAVSNGDGILTASWPAPRVSAPANRRPALFGGAGIARLGVGQGPDALDLELRGLGTFDTPRSARLSLRANVAGRPVLDDLDENAARTDGLELASASHNTVLIDGRNQREDLDLARIPAPASNFLFFAASDDLQVAAMEDQQAYPRSGLTYRQVLIASAGRSSRYGVAVFEVEGGHQHDQMWYAPAGEPATSWSLPATASASPGPDTLLGPSFRYLPSARAAQGRWFVQALGSITGMSQARLDRPTAPVLTRPEGPGLRLHLLGDVPTTAVAGRAPGSRDDDRAALVLRRASGDGRTLRSTFVTVLEPIADAIPPLARVGRVESPPGSIVLLIRTSEGDEHLVLNLQAGKETRVRLADGRALATDGLAVRVRGDGLVLAGGTRVDLDDVTVLQRHRTTGTITGALADGTFVTDTTLAEPDRLAGQALIIRHGDRTARAWTIVQAVNLPDGSSRLHVREAAGFTLDPASGEAQYLQFPRTRHPAPHAFVISGMARVDAGRR
jgi:hypothetical protein